MLPPVPEIVCQAIVASCHAHATDGHPDCAPPPPPMRCALLPAHRPGRDAGVGCRVAGCASFATGAAAATPAEVAPVLALVRCAAASKAWRAAALRPLIVLLSPPASHWTRATAARALLCYIEGGFASAAETVLRENGVAPLLQMLQARAQSADTLRPSGCSRPFPTLVAGGGAQARLQPAGRRKQPGGARDERQRPDGAGQALRGGGAAAAGRGLGAGGRSSPTWIGQRAVHPVGRRVDGQGEPAAEGQLAGRGPGRPVAGGAAAGASTMRLSAMAAFHVANPDYCNCGLTTALLQHLPKLISPEWDDAKQKACWPCLIVDHVPAAGHGAAAVAASHPYCPVPPFPLFAAACSRLPAACYPLIFITGCTGADSDVGSGGRTADDDLTVLDETADADGEVTIMRQLVLGRWQGLDGFRESEFDLDEPAGSELYSWYTTALSAVAVSCTEGRGRVLVIGLGGGSILAFLRRHCPALALSAVERDPQVSRSNAAARWRAFLLLLLPMEMR